MSWGLILQTIGTILMVVGNIISLTELWRQRLDNLVKRYSDKSTESFKDSMYALVKWIKYSETKEKDFQEEEYQKQTNQLENKSMDFIWSFLKKRWVERFRNRFIYIGISLIISR